jgi:hypothetical protein
MNKIDFVSRIIAFSTLIFLLGSCSNDSGDDTISYDLTGNWKVIYFQEGDTRVFKTDENSWLDINNGDITAEFDQPDQGGMGVISGITVTNSYTGNYEIGENGEITIKSVATTLINEPEWTNLFRITSIDSYEVKNARLYLYYSEGSSSIVLERI